MEETYYWLSASKRKMVLLKTFVKSWKWTLPILAVTYVSAQMIASFIQQHPVMEFVLFIASFTFFWVTRKEKKLKEKSLVYFQSSYCLAVCTVLLRFFVHMSLTALLFSILWAIGIFLLSLLLYDKDWGINIHKIQLLFPILIVLAVVIEFICILQNITTYYVFSGVFCFIFFLLNLVELKHMDNQLKDALTKTEERKLTGSWTFTMITNFIGMFFFPDAIRIVSKLSNVSLSKAVSF